MKTNLSGTKKPASKTCVINCLNTQSKAYKHVSSNKNQVLKLKNKLIAIGYWKSIYENEFPDPAKFEYLNWSLEEKSKIITHLKNGKSVADWMGKSWCRFRCGENEMGSSCFTDGKYLFPEKLIHYIEKHHVRLPNEFIKHVLNYEKHEIPTDLNEYQVDYSWWKKEIGFDSNTSKNSFESATEEEIKRVEKRKTATNNRNN